MTRISPTRHVARAARDRPAVRSFPAPVRNAVVGTSFAGPRRKGLDSMREGFATMEQRFRPSAAKGLDARMQFELTGEGGGEWFVVIKDGRCTVTSGRGEDPDTTLTASAADYLKISNGEMNKVLALLRGKLRVKGDMGKVRPFFGCFDKR